MQQAAQAIPQRQNTHQRRKLPQHEQENHRPFSGHYRSAGPTKTPTLQRSMQQQPPSGQRSTLTPLSINLSMLGIKTPQPNALPQAQHHLVGASLQYIQPQPQPPPPLQQFLPQNYHREGAGRHTPMHARGMASPMIISTSKIGFSNSQLHTAPRNGGDLTQRRKQGGKRSGPGRDAEHSNSQRQPQQRQQGQPNYKPGPRNLRIRLNAHDGYSDKGADEPPDGLSSGRLTEILAWGTPPIARDAHLDERLREIYADTGQALQDHAEHCRLADS